MVDDHSHFTWTYLIEFKSQAFKLLEHHIKYLQTQFGGRVQFVRTDNNGMEFLRSSCQMMLKDFRILHQIACPYMTQQNEVVECKHQHLLQVTRALLFQAKLPSIFWGEAVLMATHLIKKLPSSVLHWSTPYHCLFGSLPAYDHLRIFGCLCFGWNLDPHKQKLSPEP